MEIWGHCSRQGNNIAKPQGVGQEPLWQEQGQKTSLTLNFLIPKQGC